MSALGLRSLALRGSGAPLGSAPPPLVLVNGTATNTAGDTIRLPVPPLGSATHCFYGWNFIEDDLPVSRAALFAMGNYECTLSYDPPFNGWLIGDASPQLDRIRKGWVFCYCELSTTTLVFRWIREGSYEIGERSFSISFPDNSTYLELGEALGDHQYWGYREGVLTRAQTLAQSQATTQLVAGRSFWPLEENSNVDVVGGHSATISAGCSTSARAAPVGPLGTPDESYATLFMDRTGVNVEGRARYAAESPLATSNDFSLSVRAKLPNDGCNAYIFSLATADNSRQLTFVIQMYAVDYDQLYINLMSTENGDFAVRPIVIDNSIATDWFDVLWTFTRVDGNTHVRTYARLVGVPFAMLGGVEILSIPEIFDDQMFLRSSVGNSSELFGVNMYNLKVHDHALTLEEGEVSTASTTPDSSAWGHWRLRDGSFKDSSGNGRDLLRTLDEGHRGILI